MEFLFYLLHLYLCQQCACFHACVCVCVRARVRARACASLRACVRACMRAYQDGANSAYQDKQGGRGVLILST